MCLLCKGQRNSCILDSLSLTHPHSLIPQWRPQETPSTSHTLEQTHKQVCGYKWAHLSISSPSLNPPPFALSHVFRNTHYIHDNWLARKKLRNCGMNNWDDVSAWNILSCGGLSGSRVGLATSCLWRPLLICFTQPFWVGLVLVHFFLVVLLFVHFQLLKS